MGTANIPLHIYNQGKSGIENPFDDPNANTALGNNSPSQRLLGYLSLGATSDCVLLTMLQTLLFLCVHYETLHLRKVPVVQPLDKLYGFYEKLPHARLHVDC